MKKHTLKTLKAITGLKILFAILCSFTVFTHPHIIRQTDTLATAFRYWQRWVIEGNFSLLPSVLTAGDGHGVQSMEFPLINLLFANSFYFGIDAGRIIAQIGLLAISLFLTYLCFNIWKKTNLLKEDALSVFLLLLITSVSSTYFYRFMPDYLSFILVTMSVGLSFTSQRLPAWVLCSLGLLFKPPSVIALGPLLLFKNFKVILKKDSFWILCSILVACAYYTFGMKYLRSISDQPEYFYTEFRNPKISLLNFFSLPKQIWELLLKNLFGKLLLIPLLLFSIWNLYKTKKISSSKYLLVLLLQIFTIALLDGDHAFVHDYYFIGASFICALIILDFLHKAPTPLIIMFFMILISSSIEKGIYETRPLFFNNNWKTCKSIKERHPEIPWNQSYPFQSQIGPKPYAGLCFGEKQGSLISEYGIFMSEEIVPETCKVIDEENGIRLTRCE